MNSVYTDASDANVNTLEGFRYRNSFRSLFPIRALYYYVGTLIIGYK